MIICLDNNAAIAAFQLRPAPVAERHRERVRAFLCAQHRTRILFPSVALGEYLFPFPPGESATEFAELTRRNILVPEFNSMTAEIAAQLGREYANGRRLSDVAKQIGSDRVCLKLDLMIIASALQHQASVFLTDDTRAAAVATFAKLKVQMMRDLPDPAPPATVPPLPPARQGTLFQDEEE